MQSENPRTSEAACLKPARTIDVAAGAGYRVEITPGLLSNTPALAERLAALLGLADGRRAVIVTDSNVAPLWAGRVEAALREVGGRAHAGTVTIPAGEPSKTPATLVSTLERMAALELTRRDAVIALGGGVVGDLAGLAAALYMRGVACLQIPTSLLAMVDSSVGGKTAVDLEAGKNLMGAFSQPRGVLIDPEALSTLPAREVSCGWGEIIKYGSLDPAVEALVERELAAPKGAERAEGPAPLPSLELIAESIDVKRRIVSEDERESGVRRLLNLGHTVGHAVETASNYALSHGACVGIGMRILVKALVAGGRLPQARLAELDGLLAAADLPRGVPPEVLADPRVDMSPEALEAIARHDKKSAGSDMALVLPDENHTSHVERVSWERLLEMIRIGL